MLNCRKRKFDGVICGHIHTPAIRELDGVTYMNDGDWCENCSALVTKTEHSKSYIGPKQTNKFLQTH